MTSRPARARWVAVAAPAIVALFYPTITQVAAAGAIAPVMALAVIGMGVGRADRPHSGRAAAPDVRPSVDATPPAHH